MITRIKDYFTRRYVLVFRTTDGETFARVRLTREEYLLIENTARTFNQPIEEFVVALVTDIARTGSVIALKKI